MFQLPPYNCYKCGRLLDASSHINDANIKPNPGDFTICIYCASVLVFNDDLTARAITDEELLALSEESRQIIIEAVEQILNFISSKRNK
jgi:hypothetical protein